MKQPSLFDANRTTATFLPRAQTAKAFVALIALTFAGVHTMVAQGTAFTYQGRFTDNGAPYTGNVEIQATLWDAISGGSQIAANAPAQVVVGVTNGLFVLPLNFGATFPGANRWLKLEVRTSIGAFTTLTPRQPLTPTPYAITAGNLAGPVVSANLAGTYSSALTFNNAANSFSGSGTGLTALDAGQLTSGAVPDARLGANVARTDQVWLLGGNAGTTPGTHFVGTTGNQPLELRVNGARAFRLEPNATSPNVIGGYASNSVSPGVFGATIAGGGRDGFVHTISAHHGTIGGGDRNVVSGEDGTIAGGGGNYVAGNYASIGGGLFNINLGFIGTIAGGRTNTIPFNADYATIGGGYQNTIQTSAHLATIGGGYFNRIRPDAPYTTISGGYQNTVQTNAAVATISGGQFNTIQIGAVSATISGGSQNTIQANADYATIPGGYLNNASSYAFAAGRQAKAIHTGAFVWADNQVVDFASTADNQFCIRANGGVRLNGDTSIAFGTTTRQMLNFYDVGFGMGVQTGTLYARSNTRFSWFKDGTHSDAQNDPGAGGSVLMTLTAANLTVNGAIVLTSDRAAKENFAPVQPREVLEKVIALPLSSWNYKTDTATRHLGPMAQDFYAAFNVGPDDKHIATVDADGVALAAIQGLNQKLTEELKRRDAENAEAKEQNRLLGERLERLEKLLPKN